MLSMRRFFAMILCFSLMVLPIRGESETKYVALTFDDGPSGRFTRTLLDGLEKRQVKATFLLCGYRLEQYGELAERMVREGHEIGLHGYSHNCMSKMCLAQLERELNDTIQLLPKNYRPAFLRPPGGECSAVVQQAARDAGLAILQWNVDPRDWAIRDAAAIEKAVLCKVEDGDVILLHDMSDSSVEAALTIVDTLRAKGFEFVTASELARLKEITPEPGKIYCHFRGD